MNLIFICTGNTCRSPMAAAIFQKLAAERGLPVNIRSAGMAAVEGEPASPNAVQACREIGIDLSAHRSRQFRRDDLSWADLFLVMSPSHAAVLTQAGIPTEKIRILDMPDPYGGSLEVYRACRDALTSCLERLAGELSEAAHG